MNADEKPRIKLQVRDEWGRVVWTVYEPVKRVCEECGADFQTTMDVCKWCNECFGKKLAEALIRSGALG